MKCSKNGCSSSETALDSSLALAHYNRGIAYHDLRQYQRAIQDYDEAIRLNPQDAEAYNNRGFAYFSLGQHQRAIQDLDEAIRLNPQYAMAYLLRALAYTSLSMLKNSGTDRTDVMGRR